MTAVLFVLLLAGATLAATAASVVGRRPATLRDHARRGLAAAMVVAGLAHLLSPEPFVQHVPGWVPGREPLVLLTGLIEIGLGCALAGSPARRVATGRVLALYLVAVWPANVYVAVAGVDVEGQPGGRSPWIRLPFQALFIAWALWSTGAGATVSEGSAPSTRPGAATTDGTRGRSEP